MNVILLTPDRVGSTLLQRMLTIYMSTCEYDKPVINLHELSNGLEYYFSDIFNQFVLGKPSSTENWGYHQSLDEIINLLKKADHYKTSRLAHYHLERRKDTIAEQASLYKYINENFFIISCQRKNVFEYALSWGIFSNSKKLNVFNHNDKIKLYDTLYKNKITIPSQTLIRALDAYQKYIEWSKTYFNVNSFYIYEDHSMNIEKYIADLSIFNTHGKPNNWETMFGLSWNDWNRCHKLISDLTFNKEPLLLPDTSKKENMLTNKAMNTLPVIEQQFLYKNSKKYANSMQVINELIENKALVTGIPIKLQTLAEKKMIVKNFNELVDIYNEWANNNNFSLINNEEIVDNAMNELKIWYETSLSKILIT